MSQIQYDVEQVRTTKYYIHFVKQYNASPLHVKNSLCKYFVNATLNVTFSFEWTIRLRGKRLQVR